MNEHLAVTIELSTSGTSIIKLIAYCTIENFIFDDDSLFLKKIEGVIEIN